PHDGASRRSHGRRSARSGREAGAPLPATGSDDRAPGARAHAVTEAVTVRPATVVGPGCGSHLAPPRPRDLLRGRPGPAAGTGSLLRTPRRAAAGPPSRCRDHGGGRGPPSANLSGARNAVPTGVWAELSTWTRVILRARVPSPGGTV